MDLTPAQVARTDQELAGFEACIDLLCMHWDIAIPDESRAVRLANLMLELTQLPADHLAALVAVAVDRLA